MLRMWGIAFHKACTATVKPSFLLIIRKGRNTLSSLNTLKIFKPPLNIIKEAIYTRYIIIIILTERITITKSSKFGKLRR